MSFKRFQVKPSVVACAAVVVLTIAGGAYAASRSSGVKVRCTATRNGKPVTCRVVTGPSNPSGPTTLTQAPSFALVPGTMSSGNVGLNSQSSDTTNLEFQQMNVYSFYPNNNATMVFRTYLLSPSEIAGRFAHLHSVDFCYGLQNSTLGSSQPAYLKIIRATVREFVERDAVSQNGPMPVYLPNTTLATAPLNVGTTPTGRTGCKNVAFASPPLILRGGYLALDVEVSFTAPNPNNGHPFQGWLDFGRVATTYGP
ncbi:MAG: hypothetical protein ACJ764_01905 [Solirubrobacteraceae bacterium]